MISGLTHLETTQKLVINRVLEELLTSILIAGPTPHVLASAIRPGAFVDSSPDNPHDETDKEKADRECGIVERGLLGAAVTALPVSPENNQAGKERNTSHGQ